MVGLFPSLSQALVILPVKTAGDLNRLSKNLVDSAPTAGNYDLEFSHYKNAGQLKVDKPSANVQVLQLKRSSPDSDNVIEVDSTFIDVKQMTGTLILKGLAIHLNKPKATLIAGADNVKVNHNLVIDSCFIYADSLDVPFLSWQSDTSATVEIKNSWFVVRAGIPANVGMQISAPTILLNGNLFNFPGYINGKDIGKKVEVVSNTVNRTQFDMVGRQVQKPTYFFNQNLIAHHGAGSYFGPSLHWVASLTGFDLPRSFISYNRLYSTWLGFDYPDNKKFSVGEGNKLDSTYDGKPVTELWNWYTDVKDSASGMLSGSGSKIHYNVVPGQGVTNFSGILSAYYKPAGFPRRIDPGIVRDTVVFDPALRGRYPIAGSSLYFGQFQLDSIRMSTRSPYGKPLLLAKNEAGLFARQPAPTRASADSIYENQAFMARYFVLADSGNTPRGNLVVPKADHQAAEDRLRFSKVDLSGMTAMADFPFTGILPKDLRMLNRIFGFLTTASVKDGTVDFGQQAGTTPAWSSGTDSIYWFMPPDTRIPVTYSKTGPDANLYLASAPFTTENSNPLLGGARFAAYLVEKLSVPKDGANFTFTDGSIRAVSPSGYQLYVDSTVAYDKTNYGEGTPTGFSFAWKGRTTADTLVLNLKAKPNTEAFVLIKGNPTPQPLPQYHADSTGFFRIPIGMDDSAKVFLLAVKYNIVGGAKGYDGDLPGNVTVTGLTSATSGKMAFAETTAEILKLQGAVPDTNFRNVKFLGGRTQAGIGITLNAPYGISFAVSSVLDSTRVEAWAFDTTDSVWRRLPNVALFSGKAGISGVPFSGRHIVVVERIEAPEIYVTPTLPVVAGNTLSLNLKILKTAGPVQLYCVQTKSIDVFDTTVESVCQPIAPTDTARALLSTDKAYLYRIIYFTGADTVRVVREYQLVPGVGWNAKENFPGDQKVGIGGKWRLLGFPVKGLVGDFLARTGPPPNKDSIRDTTLLLRLRSEPAAWDTVKAWAKDTVNPGTAFLFAASGEVTMKTEALNIVRTPKPETLHVGSGWHFIANPFPISLKKSHVRTVPQHSMMFKTLTYEPTAVAQKYGWDTNVVALNRFHGYAYYSPGPELIIFDPAFSDGSVSASVAKRKTSADALGSRFRIEVAGVGMGAASVALTTVPGEIPIPVLSTPSSRLEMRLGAREGLWIKPVGNLAGIDEQVEIRSAGAGNAVFQAGEGKAFLLIDEATGAQYAGITSVEMPVDAGSRTYRLLAGDAAFISGRRQAFFANLPTVMALSQNYPNPFRGRTSVSLDWPATQSPDRRAVLAVYDMQGRNVSRIRLDGIRAGRQTLVLDASGWQPGLYIYSLKVTAGGRTSRLQKRMMVSP